MVGASHRLHAVLGLRAVRWRSSRLELDARDAVRVAVLDVHRVLLVVPHLVACLIVAVLVLVLREEVPDDLALRERELR
eukprot:12361231-Heterocapsa_arctica.AAC.1